MYQVINKNYLKYSICSRLQFSSFLSSATLGLEMSALGEELQEEEEEAPWCGERENVVFQLRNLNGRVEVFIVFFVIIVYGQ